MDDHQAELMDRYVAYVLMGIGAVLFALFALARRFPHIEWLQLFRFERPYDSSRDRHLDTTWMDPTDRGQGRRDAPREVFAEIREQYRAFRAAMPQLPPEQEARMRRRRDVVGGSSLSCSVSRCRSAITFSA
jgi:hypothetical protein